MKYLIDGKKKYSLNTVIGSGGFGKVYESKKENNQSIAIKILGENIEDISEDAFSEWQRESDIVLGLEHPNVVKAFEAGKGLVNKKPVHYITMELASNGNLSRLIDDYQKDMKLIEESSLIDMFKSMLNGLQEIHKSILHRDIKPQNILIVDDKLKITDFGLAKYVDEITRTKTYKGWGTYFYMAPEVWGLNKTSKATDIYSLGIIFYQLATLKLPYASEDVKQLEELHCYGSIPRAIDSNPNLSHRVDSIITKMLQKAPKNRYQSAEEVLDAFSYTYSPDEVSSESMVDIINLAKRKIDSDTKEEAAIKEKEDRHRRILKICETHIDSFLNSLNAVIGQINEQMPEKQLSISKGSKDIYDVIWGTSNLLRVEFNPGIEVYSYMMYDKNIIMHASITIWTGNRSENEGTNLFYVNSPDDEFGELKIIEVTSNPLRPMGFHKPIAFKHLYEIGYFIKGLRAIGDYQHKEVPGTLEQELERSIQTAFRYLIN